MGNIVQYLWACDHGEYSAVPLSMWPWCWSWISGGEQPHSGGLVCSPLNHCSHPTPYTDRGTNTCISLFPFNQPLDLCHLDAWLWDLTGAFLLSLAFLPPSLHLSNLSLPSSFPPFPSLPLPPFLPSSLLLFLPPSLPLFIPPSLHPSLLPLPSSLPLSPPTHPPTNLMVESLDPVMMTLSSYCRHSTEPVWPCKTVVQLWVVRSQTWWVWKNVCTCVMDVQYHHTRDGCCIILGWAWASSNFHLKPSPNVGDHTC